MKNGPEASPATGSGRWSARKIKGITLLLLLVGLGSALAIYLTAEPVVVDPLLGDPLTTKKYLHELRTLGGKGNVLAAEFIDGFGGLWRGRNLAGTIAVLTVIATLVFRFVAVRPDLYAPDPGQDENQKPPPGHGSG